MKSTGIALHYKYNILYINKLHNKYQFPSVRATASYLPHNCIIPVIATTFRLPPCHCLPASVTIRCPALPGRTTFRLTPRTGIIPPPRTTPHLPLRTKTKQNKTKQDKTAAPGMASMVQRLYLIMAYKIRCKDIQADGRPQ